MSKSDADPETWSLRPNDEERRLVEQAMKATGSKRQNVILGAMRLGLVEYVRKTVKDRDAAAQAFFK